MGIALGLIMKPELDRFIPSIFEYGWNMSVEFLMEKLKMSEKTAKIITETVILPIFMEGLEMTYERTKAFTPQRFMDEIQGIADASIVPAHVIMLINQIPEFLKATCSMIGAWGPSIAPGTALFQLRALDWAINGPFNDYPLFTVFHPDPVQVPGSMPFSTFGYPGFVGALTGYSSAPVGISEKEDAWFGFNGTSTKGYPWHYVLRDILEFDKDMEAAYKRMFNANKTCSIWVGMADYVIKQFRMVAYGYDYLEVYNDQDSPIQPRFPGVVYNDPHGYTCMADLISNVYGNIDANAIINITAADNTGFTHVAIYDFLTNYVYLAHTSSEKTPPIVIASLRPYCRVDMNSMWAEPMPQL